MHITHASMPTHMPTRCRTQCDSVKGQLRWHVDALSLSHPPTSLCPDQLHFPHPSMQCRQAETQSLLPQPWVLPAPWLRLNVVAMLDTREEACAH